MIVRCLFMIVACVGLTLFSFCEGMQEETYDLTVVGSMDFNGSVRRHAIGVIECLHDKLKINFIPSRDVNLDEVSAEVKKVVLCENKTPGNVILLEDPLWYTDAIPKEGKIKIAFCVFESTRIPQEWVKLLNTQFDIAAVADEFYIKVFEESGVNIPIFHIPLGIYINEFLQKPLKQNRNNLFVFMCCARYFPRKNHMRLIEAFAAEFGNVRNVKLVFNGGGKWGNNKYCKELKYIVQKTKLSNIYIYNKALPWDKYVNFMSDADCYVNISQGEGFSITPREALALGIPTIVTDNTAQKTICSSGLVRSVPCKITFPFYQEEDIGFRFDCTVEDVREALRDVYAHYSDYLAKAHQGREWVKQYLWSSLQGKYLSLIKPSKVILGDRNEVTDEYFMTNSPSLYQKYLDLVNKNSR